MRTLTLAATLLVLIGTGCDRSSSPTSPEAARVVKSCGSGCDGVVRPPVAHDAEAAMKYARDAVRAAVAAGRLNAKKMPNWDALPSIEYRPCYFWVDNASWVDASGKQVTGGACAAGMTDYENRKIVVSTAEQPRIIPLVKWETANYFLVAIGRNDLTDAWQSGNIL